MSVKEKIKAFDCVKRRKGMKEGARMKREGVVKGHIAGKHERQI